MVKSNFYELLYKDRIQLRTNPISYVLIQEINYVATKVADNTHFGFAQLENE